MNNRNFKKSLLAVAAGAALASVGMTAANANSLLFPYFTTANGAQSYLTLAAGANADANGVKNNIHYVFGYYDPANARTVTYKSGDTASNVCRHFDVKGTLTANDLIQQGLYAGPTAISGPDLFGGTTSVAGYMPLQAAGYLIVTNTSVGSTPAVADLTGSMVVYDPNSGMVTSYKGVFGKTNSSVVDGDFSNIADTNFRLTWYPYSIATTNWYYVVAGDESNAIGNARPWDGGARLVNSNSVWNRDEGQVSGSIGAAVACAGQLTLNPAMAGPGVTPLLSAPQYNALGNGGIIDLAATGLTANTSNDAGTGLVLAKVETTSALGPKASLVTIENNIATNRGGQN